MREDWPSAHVTHPSSMYLDIYLDEVKQHNIISASTDGDDGWVTRYVIDKNGKIVTKDNSLSVETVHGKVRIVVLEKHK